MSFILDALRKSEHQRQEQKGPGFAEVPVAAPRSRTNVWATAAVVLLLVNLVAIGVVLLRRSHDAPAAAAPEAAVPAPVATAPAATPAAATVPAAQASITQTLPQPMLQDAPRPTAASGGRNPLESEVSGGPPELDPGMAARAAAVPPGPRAVTPTTSTRGGRVVYESLPEANPVTSPGAQSASGLPGADEVSATNGLPELHLDLHVYSTRPQERFIFVNSHKYREGDTLQEGPVVEQITPNGAVLSFRGNRFMLGRD